MEQAIGSVADVTAGSVAAREVDRFSRPVKLDVHHFDGVACRNCDTTLDGAYCQTCGQAAHLHRDFIGFAHDVLHGVFHFDGKFWSTLPKLAWYPGELTRRYIDGERQKFVSPIAMFLFSVFLMFAIASNVSGLMPASLGAPTAANLNAAKREIGESVVTADARIARLEARRTAAEKANEPVDKIDAELNENRKRREGLVAAASYMSGGDQISPKVEAKATGAPPPTASKVESWTREKLDQVRDNPKLFIYKMKTSGYKYSWALIPLSLPFLWLMFAWRRRFGVYDHAVFATYSIAAMSLMMVVLTLIASLGDTARALAWAALFIVPPVHMYRQLRGGYLLSRFSALWRAILLLHVVLITSLLFFMGLVWMGIAA